MRRRLNSLFHFETDLDHILDGYEAMDDRRAIKTLVRIADDAGESQ